MKKSLTIMMCLFLLVGMSSVSVAQTTTGKGITDPAGDAAKGSDLIGAAAEFYERKRLGKLGLVKNYSGRVGFNH